MLHAQGARVNGIRYTPLPLRFAGILPSDFSPVGEADAYSMLVVSGGGNRQKDGINLGAARFFS